MRHYRAPLYLLWQIKCSRQNDQYVSIDGDVGSTAFYRYGILATAAASGDVGRAGFACGDPLFILVVFLPNSRVGAGAKGRHIEAEVLRMLRDTSEKARDELNMKFGKASSFQAGRVGIVKANRNVRRAVLFLGMLLR